MIDSAKIKRLADAVAKVASLPWLEGYRTYLGAAGQAIAAVAAFAIAANSYWAEGFTDKTTMASVAGVALISHALAALGIGKKLDDVMEDVPAEDFEPIVPPSLDATAEHQPLPL